MDDLISRQQAIDKIKQRLFETAFNNVGIKQNIDETLVDVAENRLETWFDEQPTIEPEQWWIPVTEESVIRAGYEGREVRFRIRGRLFAIRELAQ